MSKALKCSSCGASNNDIAKFCTSCGNKIVLTVVSKPTTTTTTASPSAPSKSFLAPTVSKVAVTTTTTTTRPVSTIIKPTTTTTTTSSPSRPASTIIKPTTTTTTTAIPSKSILKPTTPVTSSAKPSTTTTAIPSKSILKPVPTTAPVVTTTRPKSHTISVGSGSKPTKTSTSLGTTSFVKQAAMNRESLDNKAHRDSMILQGAPVLSAPVVSTPPPTKTTTTTKKPTTTTTPVTTTRPTSMSVSISKPSPTSEVKSKSDLDKLEKQIQIDKEKFIQKEREIEKQRQLQYEKDKQIEREKQLLEKEKQHQLEREKQEHQKQIQLEKEREKHELHEREKQKHHEKDRLKQVEKEEKEKQHQERERLKQQEKEEKEKQHQERERLKQLDKEERERLKKQFHSTPIPRKTSDGASSPSLINSCGDLQQQKQTIEHQNDNSNIDDSSNISNSNSESFESVSTSTSSPSNKKKRDKEKQKSRIFSLFTRVKDDNEDDDELIISSPCLGNGNGNISASSSPTPDSPSQSSFSEFNNSSGGSDRDSGDFSGSNATGGEGNLRKWAIKRNELQKSEGNLFAPSSPSHSSVNGSGSSYPIGSHSPNSSSGSLSNSGEGQQSIPSHRLSAASTSSFIPSSPSGLTPLVQMGTSRISSPNPPPDLPNNLPQAIEQRDRVIEEIIVTEADYIRDLEIMVWLKKEMIIHDNDIKGGTIDEINALFSNVEQLLLVNKELYKKFCNFDSSFKSIDTVSDTIPTSETFLDQISNGFVSMADFLKSYFVYCSNQQKALSTFSSLKGKNCTYLAYLLTRRECRSLPFDSFLIKPVQRVCKYPLLIRELIKSTPVESLSYSLLINAQSKIESIVFSVNEKKREFDSQMKMLEIQNRIIESGDNTTKILSPSRKLIKEGTITSWGSTNPSNRNDFFFKKRNKEGYYYLFNDLFIYAELKKNIIGGDSDYNGNSGLHPIKVKSELPFEYSVICDTPLDDCAFELKNKNLWCMFSFETLEEKKLLFNEIENSILSYQSVLHEYQKYIEDRLPTAGNSRYSTSSTSNGSANSANNITNHLSLSSNGVGSSSSDNGSTGLLSIEEWKVLVKNKPLPALPPQSTINMSNSPSSSPSLSRIQKSLPIPPTPPK